MANKLKILGNLIDKTLSVEGVAADAKAVGDAIQNLTIPSDWNQNDSNAKDYIKNRPFYTDEVKDMVMNEATVSYEAPEQSATKALEVGKTYTVLFDGVKYKSVCKEYGGYKMIGNNIVYPFDDNLETDVDTGEPFAIEAEGDNTSLYWHFYENDTSEHVASVYIAEESIVKIDEKYLPDTIASIEYVDSKLGEAGGTVSSVQPDWNQNDETAPDYIKNKTHYENIVYNTSFWTRSVKARASIISSRSWAARAAASTAAVSRICTAMPLCSKNG